MVYALAVEFQIFISLKRFIYTRSLGFWLKSWCQAAASRQVFFARERCQQFQRRSGSLDHIHNLGEHQINRNMLCDSVGKMRPVVQSESLKVNELSSWPFCQFDLLSLIASMRLWVMEILAIHCSNSKKVERQQRQNLTKGPDSSQGHTSLCSPTARESGRMCRRMNSYYHSMWAHYRLYECLQPSSLRGHRLLKALPDRVTLKSGSLSVFERKPSTYRQGSWSAWVGPVLITKNC